MNEMQERITAIIQQGFYDMNDGNAAAEDITQRIFEAMREPTSKMLLRANRLPACDSMHFGDIAKIWQVMVDEAGK